MNILSGLFKIIYLIIFGIIVGALAYGILGLIISILLVVAVYSSVIIIPLHLILSVFGINLLKSVYKFLDKLWSLVKGPCEKVTGYMGRRIKEILNADV